MLTLVIRDNDEPNVIKLTYENLQKEIKDIPGAEIVVDHNWFNALSKVKNKYICFVEPDCLVSSGYFNSLIGHMKKNPQLGKLGILSTATAVDNWAVRFYGYHLGDDYSDGVIPNTEKKNTKLPFYTIQIAYIPGALIRTGMLRTILKDTKLEGSDENLVNLSTKLSFAFWKKNYMINIAHNSTYVSTEKYINEITKCVANPEQLAGKFKAESI